MPHPHFNTDSEMNSCWRHYYNNLEAEESRKDDDERHTAAKKKNKKQPPASQPKPNRQGLVPAEDGWFTVVSTKKN